jgi:hypothetical protein
MDSNDKPVDVEKPAHIEDTNEAPYDNNPLKKELTLTGIDTENRAAYKGDDSDGKVTWSIKRLFAGAFLAMLYTGKPSLSSFTLLLNIHKVLRSFFTSLAEA